MGFPTNLSKKVKFPWEKWSLLEFLIFELQGTKDDQYEKAVGIPIMIDSK
jgi:hypothetical protein